ncbi:histamine H4 receptor [Leptonychotes weddellii]|uniref:Histamine H4 receptor n=1 Tax=Leptonychotes weddellii TaxID=9713 RepID=A0A2U3YB28_LEPWE|nr:histamine H4 receptor [Leptonychotes weddellii]
MSTTNSTRAPTLPLSPRITLAFLMGLLAFAIMLGNAVVILAFVVDKKLRHRSNYFFLNLAIADFFVGMVSIPLYIPHLLFDWDFGNGLCAFWLIVDYLLCTASVYNIVLISYDRYQSVSNALRNSSRERHFMADCSIISDVDVKFDHLVKVVAARSLHCKGRFPKSPWLNNLICQYEALIGQYLPLDEIVYFQQIWLQGEAIQSVHNVTGGDKTIHGSAAAHQENNTSPNRSNRCSSIWCKLQVA